MKLVSALLLLVSTSAFAYGPRFATGKAVNCKVYLKTDVPYCRPHIVSETKPTPLLKDINGNMYTTVEQTIDNADCSATQAIGAFDPIATDTTQSFYEVPKNLMLPSISTYPRATDADERDFRKGVIYYVTRSFTPAAAAKAKADALAAINGLVKNLVVAYDPASHKFTFQSDTFLRQVFADLSPGRSTREPDYAASVTLDSTSSNVFYHITLSCASESARKP